MTFGISKIFSDLLFDSQTGLYPKNLGSINFETKKHLYIKREKFDIYNTLSVHDGEAFAESIDRYRANWFVSYFERTAPH